MQFFSLSPLVHNLELQERLWFLDTIMNKTRIPLYHHISPRHGFPTVFAVAVILEQLV